MRRVRVRKIVFIHSQSSSVAACGSLTINSDARAHIHQSFRRTRADKNRNIIRLQQFRISFLRNWVRRVSQSFIFDDADDNKPEKIVLLFWFTWKFDGWQAPQRQSFNQTHFIESFSRNHWMALLVSECVCPCVRPLFVTNDNNDDEN